MSHRRGIPLQAKFLLSLVLFVAAVSTGKLRPTMSLYLNRHLNAQTSTTAVPTLRSRIFGRVAHQPRVVFYNEKAWSLADEPFSRKQKSQPAMDFVQLQRRSIDDAEDDEDFDITRYYQVGDSAEDFPSMERRLWPQHEFDLHCKPKAAWQSTFHPVCNVIHADADFRKSLVDEELLLLSSKGFWRHAWRHDQKAVNAAVHNPTTTTVWKTFKMNHAFEEKFYDDQRVDVVAMERLTGSPYIINVYGFCGMTVVVEYAGRELMHVLDAGKLSSTEKLKLARKIAQGVADIHSIPQDDGKSGGSPSLVHNDINLANLLFTADGRPVWNDFNIAILLMEHNETHATCPFYSHFPNPQWKAPEEQVVKNEESEKNQQPIVNEKIDIYALGNIFYRMAVGSNPWKRPDAVKLYPEELIAVARLKRDHGMLPPVPAKILVNAKKAKDPALASLLKAMRRCYSFNPADRPTAAELVDFLDIEIKKATSWKAFN